MAKFVQIIEFKTQKIDQVVKHEEEWRAATEGKRALSRSMVLADRDNPGRYFVIAEFASYDEAMKNNDLPETEEFAQKQMAVSDGPPTFYNLDVIHEKE